MHLFGFQRDIRRLVLVEEVERPFSSQGEIFGGVFSSGAVLVFAEDDVEAPVQTIFDAPVLAHSVRKLFHVVTY